jgi:hypothetical protein
LDGIQFLKMVRGKPIVPRTIDCWTHLAIIRSFSDLSFFGHHKGLRQISAKSSCRFSEVAITCEVQMLTFRSFRIQTGKQICASLRVTHGSLPPWVSQAVGLGNHCVFLQQKPNVSLRPIVFLSHSTLARRQRFFEAASTAFRTRLVLQRFREQNPSAVARPSLAAIRFDVSFRVPLRERACGVSARALCSGRCNTSD